MTDVEAANVTIRVRVGDNEVEVTGPSDFVESKIDDLLKRLGELPAPGRHIAKHEPPAQPTSEVSEKRVSESQFFKQVDAGSDVDRVLAAGYYLEKHRAYESFTAPDVREAIREAKISPPKNPNDSINSNIRKGFMMTAGDKDGFKAFILTTDGEQALDELRRHQ